MTTITLKPKREKSILRGHPWIFSGAIAQVSGNPASGETVAVYDSEGAFLARASYSPSSQIRARIWCRDETQSIDEKFFRERMIKAISLRNDLVDENITNAVRLIHAESDGLPGVIADRYADTLVFQFLSAGAEYWRDSLVSELIDITGCKCAYERSDVEVRQLEGLQKRSGVLFGDADHDVIIHENGLSYHVDIAGGQKTGFYLDQRRNRRQVGKLVSNRSVLNCFCYSGGFSVQALAGGAARVVSIDSSSDAIQLAEKNLEMNKLGSTNHEFIEGDVFQVLRTFRDSRKSYDAIILDPPKFAPTAAQAARAARGYKDINLLAFKLLNPGGLLFTFSCSGGISAEFFQKIVADAALDAGVNACIVDHLAQDVDHPVALNFPEGKYLKGLICRRQD